MQAQIATNVDFFTNARACFGQVIRWLESDEAMRTESEVERELRDQAEVLMLRMLQGHLDLRSARENQACQMGPRDPEVEVRSRPRRIETSFGRATLTRLGYKRAGQPAMRWSCVKSWHSKPSVDVGTKWFARSTAIRAVTFRSARHRSSPSAQRRTSTLSTK